MNSALFKMSLKSNYKLWIIFLLIMMMYVTMIIGVYDPANVDAFSQMLSMFPQELMDAMNFSITDYTMVGFISGYLYGFIMIMFPMLYAIIVGNRLIAKYVDTGSMAYLLSTPNTRRKIALTQAVFLLSSTLLLILSAALIGLGFASMLFPGELDISKYLMINLGLVEYYVLISSITFLASAIFNETRMSLSIGAGIPIAFFVINMLAGVNEKLSFLKYFTALTLYDSNQWIDGGNVIWIGSIVFIVLGLILYVIGIKIFEKKDMSL